MRIDNNAKLYKTVRKICEVLTDRGQIQWAASLKGSFQISTVPGEILGKMRHELLGLYASKNEFLSEILDDVSDAIEYLDSILGK